MQNPVSSYFCIATCLFAGTSLQADTLFSADFNSATNGNNQEITATSLSASSGNWTGPEGGQSSVDDLGEVIGNAAGASSTNNALNIDTGDDNDGSNGISAANTSPLLRGNFSSPATIGNGETFNFSFDLYNTRSSGNNNNNNRNFRLTLSSGGTESLVVVFELHNNLALVVRDGDDDYDTPAEAVVITDLTRPSSIRADGDYDPDFSIGVNIAVDASGDVTVTATGPTGSSPTTQAVTSSTLTNIWNGSSSAPVFIDSFTLGIGGTNTGNKGAVVDNFTATGTPYTLPPLVVTEIGTLPSSLLIDNTSDDSYTNNQTLSNGNSLGQKFSLARDATVSGFIVPVSTITASGNLTLEVRNLDSGVGEPGGSAIFSRGAEIPAGVMAGDLLQFDLPDDLNLDKGSYAFTLSTTDANLTLKTNERYLGGNLVQNNAGTGNSWDSNSGSLDLNFAVLGSFDSDPGRPVASSGPNIIHILVDDFGLTEHTVPALVGGIADTSAYTQGDYLSDFYETPYINTLSTEGLNFTWSFTQPNCAPSRAAYMSGQYSPRSGNGVYNVDSLRRSGSGRTSRLQPPLQGGNDGGDSGDDDDFINGNTGSVPLAQAMFNAGYVTCHIGKYHVGSASESDLSNVLNQGIEFNYGGNNKGNPGNFFASGTPRKWGSAVGPQLDPFAGNYTQAYIDTHLEPVKSTTTGGAPGGNNPQSLLGDNKHATDGVADAFIDFMNNHRSGVNKAYPIYMQFHLYATHGPLNGRPDLLAKYQAKASVPGGADGNPSNGNRTAFAALNENMDQTVERLMNYLDDPNGDGDNSDSIAANTLVIWTTDNGGSEGHTENFPLRGRKGMHLEGGVRVPMIMRMPGTIPANTSSDTLVHPIDFYPTFLDFAADTANSPNPAAATHKLDGESLYAHAKDPGNVTRERSPIFYHFPGYMDSRAYASSAVIKEVGGERFKYIYNYDPYYSNNGNSADTLTDYGHSADQYQLYNLSIDPRETVNLMDYIDIENAGDSNDTSSDREYWDYLLYKDTADHLAAELNGWLTQAGSDWSPIYATYKDNFPDGPTRNGVADGTSTGPAPASTPSTGIEEPDDFSFETLAPVFLGGNDLQFTFDSETGFTYQVQASNTLAPNSWSNIGDPIVATGSTTMATINDPLSSTEDKRFYRVILVGSPATN